MNFYHKIKELNYFFKIKLPSIIKAKIYRNGVYAFWGKYINFGDQLTPLLLKYYGMTPIHSNYHPKYGHKAEFVSVGTLLQNTPEDFSGIILGTGMDNIEKRFHNAEVLGVRGKITQKNLGLESKDIVIGDPGLLVSYVFPEKVETKWLLGIVPHFIDKNHPILDIWKQKFGHEVKIIDVQRSPKDVIYDIKQCQHIVSSSLHGLITADTFGIPNIMFTIRHDKRPTHDDHKFLDYYSGLGIDLELIEATGEETLEDLLSRTSNKEFLVQDMRKQLHLTFSALRERLKHS